MKKPVKVLSATGLAAVLATSAIVPVAAAEVPVQKADLDKYVIATEGVYVSLDKDLYTEYLAEYDYKLPKDQVLFGIQDTESDTFKYDSYTDALAEVDYSSPADAIELLKDAGIIEELEIYEGYIDDELNLAWNQDEQPEDRLNETFFYNAA